MVHALPRVASRIDYHTKAAIAYPGHISSLVAGEHNMAEKGAVAFVGFPESGDMGARYHKHMGGSLRVDVVESDHCVVLKDNIGTHKSLRQLTKDACLDVSLVIHCFLPIPPNRPGSELYRFLPLFFFLSSPCFFSDGGAAPSSSSSSPSSSICWIGSGPMLRATITIPPAESSVPGAGSWTATISSATSPL